MFNAHSMKFHPKNHSMYWISFRLGMLSSNNAKAYTVHTRVDGWFYAQSFCHHRLSMVLRGNYQYENSWRHFNVSCFIGSTHLRNKNDDDDDDDNEPTCLYRGKIHRECAHSHQIENVEIESANWFYRTKNNSKHWLICYRSREVIGYLLHFDEHRIINFRNS